MTALFIFIFSVRFILELLATGLNLKNLSQPLSPEIESEFNGLYSKDEYQKGLDYQKEVGRFSLVSMGFDFALFILFWNSGGFSWVFSKVESFLPSSMGPIATILIYWSVLGFAKQILGIPFSIYSTFVIEEKFGFNKMTVQTFIADLLKGAVLAIFLGGFLGTGLLWFFSHHIDTGWLWAWTWVTLFQLIILFIAPVWIMPLFNRYTPLTDGELKKSIENFAQTVRFPLEGIYTMDGSKRSTKANAFFTGFGKYRRLVLFDTLISQQSPTELLSVVAHEVGHFKLKHIWRMIALSFAQTFILFWAFQFFLKSDLFFKVFLIRPSSLVSPVFRTGIGLVLFSITLSPVMRLFGIFTHWRSRVHEFEADHYSVQSGQNPLALVSALKKLSKNSFSHLTPHPLRVLLDYTHPPVLERIKALRRETNT